MSHIATVEMDITDYEALAEACRELGLTLTPNATVRIFETEVSGTAIQLPGWTFPVVVRDKALVYDNYQGAWGDIRELNRLRQRYTLHATTRAAARMGRRIIKQEDRHGRIRLTLA